MTLRIANDFELPIEFVTQASSVLAKRRAGKSYLARKIVEQAHRAAQQVVIVDPKGDWWGVRSAADGKAPGLPIVIFGGERGDVPIEASAGELVAKLLVEETVSALVDLSLFRKHEVATFMASFLETLYRLKNHERYRTPLLLVIDEADAIAPQKPMPNEARMLGAANDIVRRGGQRGLGCMLISQRSAVLNKDVLTQAEVLVCLRTIAPQDLKAINAWIDVHGTEQQRRKLMDTLPSLPIGDAWVWSPGWPTAKGIFQRIHALPIETFDSGATPRPGQKRVEPKTLAQVDLDALRRHMSELLERAAADDPKKLRARIAELERQLAKKPTVLPSPPPIEVPLLSSEERAYLNRLVGDSGRLDEMTKALREVSERLHSITARFEACSSKVLMRAPQAAVAVRSEVRRDTKPVNGSKPQNEDEAKLGRGERQTLIAIAQSSDGATREQLTVVTGFKRSTRDAYIYRLRNAGYADLMGDRVVVTDAGRDWLGDDYEPLPTGEALRAWHLARLPEGERRCLEMLLEAYPDPVEREQIDERLGYARSTRDAYLHRLSKRRLVETNGRGEVRASAELFS